MEEFFEIVDDHNRVIGQAKRSECHGNPNLIHRTSHVIVRDRQFRILLQKRSMNKDIQPGRWDTAVGGHLMPGEDFKEAAIREMREELGISAELENLKFLFDLKIRNEIESENTAVFILEHSGPFDYQKEEIDDVRFWTKDEIVETLGKGHLTPVCEQELKKLLKL